MSAGGESWSVGGKAGSRVVRWESDDHFELASLVRRSRWARDDGLPVEDVGLVGFHDQVPKVLLFQVGNLRGVSAIACL